MSTAHTHPPLMGSMVGHPSVISTSRPLPSPMSTLGSPMNGLASPYPVITSSLGSPSVSLQSTPNMNFGPLSSPQVRHVGVFGRQKITMNCYFPKWLEYKVAFMYPWNYHDRIIIIFCIYIWNVCSSFTIPCQSELLRQVTVKKICTTQNPIWKYQRMCFEAEFVCFKVVKNANTTC